MVEVIDYKLFGFDHDCVEVGLSCRGCEIMVMDDFDGWSESFTTGIWLRDRVVITTNLDPEIWEITCYKYAKWWVVTCKELCVSIRLRSCYCWFFSCHDNANLFESS